LRAAPVLVSESADDLDRIHQELKRHINPRGIVEEIFVLDYAELTWEIWRLRRCKVAAVKSQFLSELEHALVPRLTLVTDNPAGSQKLAQDYAKRYFTNKRAKKWVDKFLEDFELDQSIVEARAYIGMADDIEYFERLLASAESRRNIVLRGISEYRASLADQLEKKSKQIIDGEVVEIEHVSSNKKPAAA
jgi:hypothetical protein